jgi:hypothetical protein
VSTAKTCAPKKKHRREEEAAAERYSVPKEDGSGEAVKGTAVWWKFVGSKLGI